MFWFFKFWKIFKKFLFHWKLCELMTLLKIFDILTLIEKMTLNNFDIHVFNQKFWILNSLMWFQNSLFKYHMQNLIILNLFANFKLWDFKFEYFSNQMLIFFNMSRCLFWNSHCIMYFNHVWKSEFVFGMWSFSYFFWCFFFDNFEIH